MDGQQKNSFEEQAKKIRSNLKQLKKQCKDPVQRVSN